MYSCEWLGGLFLSKRQGPSNRTVGVRTSSANLSHCDCRLTLPREHLFVSCCKCRHVCSVRSTGGNPAASIKPLKVIQDTSLRQFRLTRNRISSGTGSKMSGYGTFQDSSWFRPNRRILLVSIHAIPVCFAVATFSLSGLDELLSVEELSPTQLFHFVTDLHKNF